MALRKRPSLTSAQRPALHTAQDVARFCEVDLKTVHHWAERGKVPHFRTEGRHLRFRRNDLVRFLRLHGYPLPDEIASARPRIVLAAPHAEGWALAHDELAKKLSSRFSVRRMEHGVLALARLVSDEPDAVVLSLDDPSVGGVAALVALKSDPATSWIAIAMIADERSLAEVKDAGAAVAVTPADVGRLPLELGRFLAAG
jgi:excisionase family DNA binding protein